MHKLVLALATVAAFGLSTAAFAETPAASTSTTSTQIKPAQSQAPVAHKMRAGHRAGAKKVVRHHVRHHRVARHYGHGKKVAVKHMPAKKPVTTKSAS
jgi:hypothetical protein